MTLGTNLITNQTHNRTWIQMKARPDATLELLSLGSMGGIGEPSGSTEAIYRPSRTKRRAFDKVGESVQTPETFSSSFREGMPRDVASYIERAKKAGRKFALHVIHHQDADPDDPTKWESKSIFGGVKITELSSNEFTSFDGDDEVVLEGTLEYDQRERLFKMAFGAEAATEITKPVVAAAVYPSDWRDDADEKEIYLLAKVDTTVPHVIWSHDGGTTWTATSLTALGTDEPTDIAIVGNYIIVTSATGESYLYATRDNPTVWTEVTGGFVTSKGPTAIYAVNVANIFMVGLGGYIYKLNLPGQPVTVVDAGDATLQNLNDIHGFGSVIVAVGASNAVVYSQNAGRTWAALTGSAPATTLNAVQVVDKDTWWVGADDLYYTLDGGSSWVAMNLSIASLTSVNAITFSVDLGATGFIGYKTSTGGGVLRTTDYGATWEATSISGVPTNTGIAAVAMGGANYAVIAGAATADGVAAIGFGG